MQKLGIFKVAIFLAAFLPWVALASAQSGADHLSRGELDKKLAELSARADASGGSASVTLAQYRNHSTMLAYRSRSGGGEVHEQFSDLFVILKGHATLITGGALVDVRSAGPGELRGTSVKDGVSQELSGGDVVHISAGVPHQMVLAHGDTVGYFVVKVQEK